MRATSYTVNSDGKTYHYDGFKILAPTPTFKARDSKPILSDRLNIDHIEVLRRIAEVVYPDRETPYVDKTYSIDFKMGIERDKVPHISEGDFKAMKGVADDIEKRVRDSFLNFNFKP